MESISFKSLLKIIIYMIVVGVIGYFIGFYMLFTHTTMEIFYYLLFFVSGVALCNGVVYLVNKIMKTWNE